MENLSFASQRACFLNLSVRDRDTTTTVYQRRIIYIELIRTEIQCGRTIFLISPLVKIGELETLGN